MWNGIYTLVTQYRKGYDLSLTPDNEKLGVDFVAGNQVMEFHTGDSTETKSHPKTLPNHPSQTSSFDIR